MVEASDLLFLLAAIQGVLLSVILFSRRENHAANILLACATLALSIELVYVVYYSKGWYRAVPHLMGISYPFPFLYGPLFYLYARFVSQQAEKFRPSDLLHFLPILLAYLLSAPYYGMNSEAKIVFVEGMIRHSAPRLISVVGSLVPVQGIIYTVLIVRVVVGYDRMIKDSFSNIDRINLNWLKYLTVGMIVIWSFVGIQFFIRIFTPATTKYNVILYFLTSAFIYAIGYMGLRQPDIFAKPLLVPANATAAEKYRKSGLSEEDAESMKLNLLDYMQKEKPYLDDELTLQKLAERFNCSQHHLSEVINSKLKQSYYDFINSYRLVEFKTRVADPANDCFNLLSIAFDSGFKSKGTFNAIFKKATGTTPSKYKARLNATANIRPA